MKILFLILILAPTLSFSQKIVKNETDEFTGARIVETSWQAIRKGLSDYSYTRFRKVDSIYIMDFKDVTRKVFSVNENDLLMLKLNDGNILKLLNRQYALTSRGGGAVGLSFSNVEGINLSFYISKQELNLLEEAPVEKIRFYTSEGFIEHDIKSKLADKLQKLVTLINR